jgi:fatty acid amide hydrolase
VLWILSLNDSQGCHYQSFSAAELARRIAAGEFSAVSVLESHLDRIRQLHGRLNALVVPLIEAALKRAQKIDQGGLSGPLLGVPVSVKECFDVAGSATTIGVVARGEQIARQDAVIVERLRAAGAVIVGKANLPQLCASHECSNPHYGRTRNPWNLDRSPGGSSGGDCALVASGGVALGIGSDGGGSLRWPAHCCGVAALKPTAGRLSMAGHFELPNWRESWISPGPVARHVEDLELALHALHQPNPGKELAASSTVDLSQLRIGWFEDDGFYPPAPAVRRATQEAVQHLTDLGVQLQPVTFPEIDEAFRLFVGLFFTDGGRHFRDLLAGSPRERGIQRLLQGAALSPRSSAFMAWLFKTLGSPRLALSTRHLSRKSSSQVARLESEMADYRSRVAREFASFDAIVCPPHALPAPPHDCMLYSGGLGGAYTFLFNLLNWPAGVVPAFVIESQETSDRPNSRCLALKEGRRIELGSQGLPVGVQVAAPPWREDVVLATLRCLELHFRSRPGYPSTPIS